MSTEATKELIHRVYATINEAARTKNYDLLDAVVAPNIVDHHKELAGLAPGAAGVKQVMRGFVEAFGDFRFTVEDVLAEGDTGVARCTITGTHRGEFMGIRPTGTAVTLSLIDIFRFAEGKVVETWGESDMLGLLQQLGAIPAQEPSAA